MLKYLGQGQTAEVQQDTDKFLDIRWCFFKSTVPAIPAFFWRNRGKSQETSVCRVGLQTDIQIQYLQNIKQKC